jgi:glycerophosphoryl diester phosphodiesterase
VRQPSPPVHAVDLAGTRNRPVGVGHRGASAHAPENTLPAIELAAALAADVVEIDVRLTRDQQLVVVHDATLDRTTDVQARFPTRAPWRVGDFTLAEIRSLDAGSWFDVRFAGVGVPTLRQVLEWSRDRVAGPGLLVEVKSPRTQRGIGPALVADLIRADCLSPSPGVPALVVQSFDWTFMQCLPRRASQLRVGLLGRVPSLANLGRLSTWAAQVNPDHRSITGEFVQVIHRHGMRTWPYTVDDRQRLSELLALGVDGVITNRLDVFNQTLAPSLPR